MPLEPFPRAPGTSCTISELVRIENDVTSFAGVEVAHATVNIVSVNNDKGLTAPPLPDQREYKPKCFPRLYHTYLYEDHPDCFDAWRHAVEAKDEERAMQLAQQGPDVVSHELLYLTNNQMGCSEFGANLYGELMRRCEDGLIPAKNAWELTHYFDHLVRSRRLLIHPVPRQYVDMCRMFGVNERQ